MSRFGLVIVTILVILGSVSFSEAQLKLGFYDKTCPNAEKIIQAVVNQHIGNVPSLAAGLIRMHFHDCFVRVFFISLSKFYKSHIRGFDFIDLVKSILEKKCPGIVSCADIITLATRDSVVAIGGPTWSVPTGRRDGRISNATEALNNIPPPFGNFTTLITLFGNQGLDVKDLVLLSGAHTIGVSHCSSFSNRLFNFTGVGDQDPSLDSEYAANLKTRRCLSLADNTTKVEMDPGSRNTFDLSYYRLVLKRRGLFESDAALTMDPTALAQVRRFAGGSDQQFFDEFGTSMEKMGRIGVKTGSDGEIRRTCSVVN
ncbi:unnamed protein product [Thlaspi arvense]|uniref:Peroxidase n=1 Tax=Thlaspi arvense TaxID=13288 RepID=A0AAU9SVK2_THLAR|nr:unnamed protein product [Thlaspi arvense]